MPGRRNLDPDLPDVLKHLVFPQPGHQFLLAEAQLAGLNGGAGGEYQFTFLITDKA